LISFYKIIYQFYTDRYLRHRILIVNIQNYNTYIFITFEALKLFRLQKELSYQKLSCCGNIISDTGCSHTFDAMMRRTSYGIICTEKCAGG